MRGFEAEQLLTSHSHLTDHAEADCFFCFTNLMSDIRDFFIKTLDDSSTGIQAMMVRLQTKIGEVDPEVEKLLSKQGIKMQYFAFRFFLT